ncbi:MAG: hypothetical protein MR016_04745 [Agathobacter sp.]|nr:hypothetical protein [Agathobacter sp.]
MLERKDELMLHINRIKGVSAILRGLQASENLDDSMQDACSVLADVIDEIEMEIRKVVELLE